LEGGKLSRHDLAQAIIQHRAELGLTQLEAIAQSGLGRSTWRDLEKGRRSGMSASTGVRLDDWLGWPRGSAFEVFQAPDPDPDRRIRTPMPAQPHRYDLQTPESISLEDAARMVVALYLSDAPPDLTDRFTFAIGILAGTLDRDRNADMESDAD
jgi:Helix-turn-helix domain